MKYVSTLTAFGLNPKLSTISTVTSHDTGDADAVDGENTNGCARKSAFGTKSETSDISGISLFHSILIDFHPRTRTKGFDHSGNFASILNNV
jgi:hypothetical protein